MKTKDKIKKFVTEHKTEIKHAAVMLGVGALSGALGYCACLYKVNKNIGILNDDVGRVFNDALAKGLNPGTVFTGISDTPLTADDLGKLGEGIKSVSNYRDDVSFTHFIGIGKPINK